MIRKLQMAIETTGSDGSATGSASTSRPVSGYVVGVHVDYSTGQPATTDVTITAESPALTIVTLTNNATDGWRFPRAVAHGADGSALSGVYTEGVPVDGYVNVAVAGADNGESVTVTLLVNER